ncbi:MAG: ABC transporter ATP-binding protein [Planctomycetes bacterium]|nr:ABC transporter ATP-binding protein [Planctomycetota bacterium]
MILQVTELSARFGGKVVLRGVSFAVRPGETVALMGPNGAGKTTVLRCVLGLVGYEGRIAVDGLDARAAGVAARRRLGYVPQSPAFYGMTASEVLHFLARLRGAPRQRVDAALRRVGLAADADREVQVFSGGMKQRLSLAGALLDDPPLLLLDEPTANLDPEARAQLLGLLGELRASGRTLVLCSHRAAEVRGLVDRVILLKEGRVAADGTPDAVLPPERVALRVKAHDAAEKSRLEAVLRPHGSTPLPSLNGTFDAMLPADRAVEALERLREAGVDGRRIGMHPLEEGGLL